MGPTSDEFGGRRNTKETLFLLHSVVKGIKRISENRLRTARSGSALHHLQQLGRSSSFGYSTSFGRWRGPNHYNDGVPWQTETASGMLSIGCIQTELKDRGNLFEIRLFLVQRPGSSLLRDFHFRTEANLYPTPNSMLTMWHTGHTPPCHTVPTCPARR